MRVSDVVSLIRGFEKMAKCIRCGKECASGETMCNECKAWFQERTKGSNITGAGNGKQNTNHSGFSNKPAGQKKQENQEKKSNSKIFAIIGGVGVLAVAAIAAVVLFGGNKEDAYRQKEETAFHENDNDKNFGNNNEYREEKEDNSSYEESYYEDDYTEEPYEEEFVDDFVEEDNDRYDSTEGGIHSYGYVIDDCTWTEAFMKAQNAGGYLARINSLEEFYYIVSEIEEIGYQDKQFRIGGRRDFDSNRYYWTNEYNSLYGDLINSTEYWCKNNWMNNEPSFIDGEIQECYLDIFYYKSEDRWVMNDVPDDIISIVPSYSGKIGYIIEYDY